MGSQTLSTTAANASTKAGMPETAPHTQQPVAKEHKRAQAATAGLCSTALFTAMGSTTVRWEAAAMSRCTRADLREATALSCCSFLCFAHCFG
mmetsp:Transcript_9331/g.19253  ORF Transcript_9331/g.19253 Transcript_9331/m.19253 type:complete len:93 (+) Transcript_9331:283-561(+)